MGQFVVKRCLAARRTTRCVIVSAAKNEKNIGKIPRCARNDKRPVEEKWGRSFVGV